MTKNLLLANIVTNFESVALQQGGFRVEFDYWEGGLKRPFYDFADPDDRPILHLAVYRLRQDSWELLYGLPTILSLLTDTCALAGHLVRVLQLVRNHCDGGQVFVEHIDFVQALARDVFSRYNDAVPVS